jgi:dihydrolipoamide dehydrogenase
MLSALGAEVTIIEAMPRLLPLSSVDEAVSKVLQREFKKRKIQLLLDQTVVGMETGGEGVRVTVGPSAGTNLSGDRERGIQHLEVEKLLVCVGRAPNTGGIGLETVGVECDAKGWVLADRSLRTGRQGVWAIGDVLGPSKIMLAHAASAEGEVAAENIMGAAREMDYDTVPGAIFTQPEVAMVGLTQARAETEGIPALSATVLMRSIAKAQIIDELGGEAKIVFHAKTGRILGAHLVGPHATDLIAEATLAVRTRLTVNDLAGTIHAHPTLAEVIHEAALKAAGRPLHG